jgi:prepilin-type N-terminal cleavage/methylation domain-containing protein
MKAGVPCCPDGPPARPGSRAAKSARRVRRFSSGFTLLEILLSIAIIALLGFVMVGGTARLLADRPVSPEEVFWSAVQEGRKAALKAEHDIRLKFDRELRLFRLVDGLAPTVMGADGITPVDVALQEFPIPAAAADLTVDFLAAGKGGRLILVGGVVLESQPVPFVTFYGDGTCSAFRVQISHQGAAQTLAIDPWTCAPVLEEKAVP